MKLIVLAAFSLLLALSSGPAKASEPKVPPGLDPGGIAIALLGDGIDYTKPAIAKRLARDGEGDLIAWDFADNDIRPYAQAGKTTADAEYIIATTDAISLIVVKEPASKAAAIGQMATFVVRTPARVIAWPDGRPDRLDWPVLFQAALRFKDRLFVVPGPVRPADVAKVTDNIVFATPGQGINDRTAVLDMSIIAAELLSKQPKLTFREVKRSLTGQ